MPRNEDRLRDSVTCELGNETTEHEPESPDIDAFLIRLGMPHVKTAFPGDGNPTVEQVALEIGKSMIQIHLGLAEKIDLEDIDGHIEPRNVNDFLKGGKRWNGKTYRRRLSSVPSMFGSLEVQILYTT
jgi:hypothetical protein